MKYSQPTSNLFLLNWVLASSVGMIAGWKLFDSASLMSGGQKYQFFFTFVYWVICVGISISLMQWLVLQQIIQAKWWAVASVLGVILGGTAGAGLSEVLRNENLAIDSFNIISDLLIGGCVGLCIGVFQWFSLKKSLPQFHLWMIVNTLGWSLGLMIFRFDFPRTIYSIPEIALLLAVLQFTIPFAGITGVFFSWLISKGNLAQQNAT